MDYRKLFGKLTIPSAASDGTVVHVTLTDKQMGTLTIPTSPYNI